MVPVFLKILEVSFYGSILILLVLLLRPLLGKAPKSVRCLLWLLVGLRLVCPFTLESSLSLQPEQPDLIAEQIERYEAPGVQQLPLGGTLSEAPSGAQSGQSEAAGAAPQNPELGEIQIPDVVTPIPEAEPGEKPVDWLSVAAGVWLAGSLGMLAYTLISYVLLKRKVSGALEIGENILECPGLDSAFVLGVLRPKIYIPRELESELRPAVIAHERAHIARLDPLWKLAAFCVLAVHWFNPLAWGSYVLLCRDIELACDERVVRDMDVQQRKAYSTALLACAARRSGIGFCPVAFGEVGVKERIVQVLRYRKPGFWITAVAVAAVVIAAVCFLTNPAEDTNLPEETMEPTETTAPAEADQILWEGVDQETAAYLTQQFTDPESWYYMALCDDYISPEFMDPKPFFSNGTDGEPIPFTQKEVELLGEDENGSLVLEYSSHKVDRARADEILGEIFGITMADFRSPEHLHMSIHYYEEQDLYAFASFSPWWAYADTDNQVQILGGRLQDNGDIAITYNDGRNAPRVVTVRNVDGVWKVRSNIMVSDVQAYSTDYGDMELPWEVPETLSYEEYFSQRRGYTQNDEYGAAGTGWLADYTVECDGSRLVVRKNSKESGVNVNINSEIVWVIPSDVDFSWCCVRYKTPEYIFGIRGNELFQVDYYGNYETLLVDDTGILAQQVEYGSWSGCYLTDEVIWFVAGVSEGVPGIYRLYMPTGQVDLIYDDFSAYTDGADQSGWGWPYIRVAYSNYEVCWFRENEPFWDHYYELVEDPDSVLYTDPRYEGFHPQEGTGSMILADDLDVEPVVACYYNSAEDHYYQEVIGRISSELTYDEIYRQTSHWWE